MGNNIRDASLSCFTIVYERCYTDDKCWTNLRRHIISNRSCGRLLYKLLLQERKLGSVPLASPTHVHLVSGVPRAMEARWILARAGGRAPFLVVIFNLARVCILARKARRQRLPENEIKVSSPSLRSGGASSIVSGRVEVCLRQIYLW